MGTRRRTTKPRRYEVTIDPNSDNNSHALQIRLVGFNKAVLEVGCAAGSVTKVLKQQRCHVVGIESDKEMARIARKYCDRLIVGDVEAIDLQRVMRSSSFDVILLGDILEHLRDPLKALKNLRRFLRANAYVVASIPNIAHGSVRLSLLKGRFEYQETGLLDSTHLRFFTRTSIEELFRDAGYQILDLQKATKDPFESEISVAREDFSEEALREILADPDSYVYQFVIKAVPLDQQTAKPSSAPSTAKTKRTTRSPLGVLLALFESRRDLQRTFPEVTSGDYRNLAIWAADVVTKEVEDPSYRILTTCASWLTSVKAGDYAVLLKDKDELLKEKDEVVTLKEIQLAETLTTLAAIQSSPAWKVITAYRTALCKYFPAGSTRRRILEAIFQRLLHILRRILPSLPLFLGQAGPQMVSAMQPGRSGDYAAWHRNVNSILAGPRSEPKSRDQPIDIVLPIFNSYALVRACIESILRKTKAPYRIIIVDDASTDAMLIDYLNELERSRPVTVSRNDRNLGLVRSANIGFTHSGNDVILLNSDTIVSKDWLDKLWACAYSHSKIGIVSPFSNRATICSIPEFCKDNEMPADFDVDSFAQLVEDVSRREYPALPTAVGFCMYIKRHVIDEIGTFDESFSPGYEEENDFCMRAYAAGYAAVLDDSTFVYHEGRASFKGEGRAIAEEHLKLIQAKHPHYLPVVEGFMRANPLRPLQEKVRRALVRHYRASRKAILYVIHAPIHSDTAGGTEITCRDLVENLPSPLKYVLYPEGPLLCLEEHSPLGQRTYKYARSWTQAHLLTHAETERIFLRILDEFAVDIVHFQHLYSFPLSLVRLARERGPKVVLTCHDGYYACVQHRLLENGIRYCNGCIDLSRCDACLNKQFGYPSGYQNAWRGASRELFGMCDAVVVASHSTLRVYDKVFPLLLQRASIIEHGIRTLDLHNFRPQISDARESVLRVAFVGNVQDPVKGREMILSLMKINRRDDVEWHFFGIKSDLRQWLRGATRHSHGRIVNHGLYGQGALPELLLRERIHVVVLPYIGFEGFSLVLSEAWAAGVPAIVPDIAALGERMRQHGGGWLYPPDSTPDQVLGFMSRVFEDWTGYWKTVERTRQIPVTSILTSIGQYTKLYDELLAQGDRGRGSKPATGTLSAALPQMITHDGDRGTV